MGHVERKYKARLKKIKHRILAISQELTSLKTEERKIMCKLRRNRNFKVVKTSRKQQAASLLPSGSPATCVLCRCNINDVRNFGEKFRMGDLTFHYLCAALSPNVKRTTDDGKQWLLQQDLVNVLKQSSRVTCVFCQGSGASIHCHTCNMAYHLPCGLLSDCLCVATSDVTYCAAHRPHTQHNTELNGAPSEKSSTLHSHADETSSITTPKRRKLSERIPLDTSSQVTPDPAEGMTLFPQCSNPASPKTKRRIVPERNVGSSNCSRKECETLDGSSISPAEKESGAKSKSPLHDAAASVQTSALIAESGSVADSPITPDNELGTLALPLALAENVQCANGSTDTHNIEKDVLKAVCENIVSASIGSSGSEKHTPLSGQDDNAVLPLACTKTSPDALIENETVFSGSPSVSKQTTENTAISIADLAFKANKSTAIIHNVSLNEERSEPVILGSLTPSTTHHESDHEELQDLTNIASSVTSQQITKEVNATCINDDLSCNVFSDQNNLQKLSTVENVFKCNFVGCTSLFSCTSDLAAHRRSHAGSDSKEGPHKCNYPGCDLTFHRECSFKTHLETHEAADRIIDSGSASPIFDFDCPDSDPDSSEPESDSSDSEPDSSGCDTQDKHDGCYPVNKFGGHSFKRSTRPFICCFKGCIKTFVTAQGLKKHTLKHYPYKCDFKNCENTFSTPALLKEHKLGCHGYKCDFEGCEKICIKPHRLKLHKQGHLKLFKCLYNGCNRAFGYKESLELHQLIHNDFKPFKCHDCKKSFTHEKALAVHRKIHEGTKRYKCFYKGCGVIFLSSSNAELKAHQKTHTGEKPFKCMHPGCNSTFPNKQLRRRHSVTHDPNRKTYKCDFEGCNAYSKTKTSLKDHQLIHTGVKPFKCDHDGCELSFRMKLQLQSHIRTHTAEKPFKCKFDGCNSAFKWQPAIARHELTHTGIKPYKCNQEGCSLTFSQSSSLKRHKLTHTGARPYKCDYVGCNADFVQSFPLTLHKRSHAQQ